MYIQNNNWVVLKNKIRKHIELIEKNYPLKVFVDFDSAQIRLFRVIAWVETEVWKIYNNKDFYFYITKEYRWKWLWTIIFNLYQEISLENNDFNYIDWVYVSNFSILAFLFKKWFYLDYCVDNNFSKILLTDLERKKLISIILKNISNLKKKNRLSWEYSILETKTKCKMIEIKKSD